MDNPNPTALSAEEIKKKNERRANREESRNFWLSDWIYYLDIDQATSKKLIENDDAPQPSRFEHLAAKDIFDSEEVFDLIRNLTDPEHPLTLEQLSVVSPSLIEATLIGLMIRAKLHRCLPCRFKLDIYITPGRHNTEDAINKQLNDKERVAAALENPSIRRVINRGVANKDNDEISWWDLV